MSNSAPITLEQLFRFNKGLPHQLAAISELEEDLRLNGYVVAMRRDRPWFQIWSQAGKQQTVPPMAELIATTTGDVANTWEGIEMAARIAGAKFPQLVAAQWALESNWGREPAATNNHFGLKALSGGAVKQTKEEDTGNVRKVMARFMTFPTIRAAVEYLVSRWYRDFRDFKGVNRAATIEEAARLLMVEGYATDKRTPEDPEDYRDKLLRILRGRGALSGAPALATPAQQTARPYLRLTRAGRRDGRGLEVLTLALVRPGVTSTLSVTSGAPGAQQFRTGAASRAGSLEPLPEGRYGVGLVEWAGGVGNYSAAWPEPGLGPVWVSLTYQTPGSTARSALGFHIDANATRAPGSAGCVVFANVDDLRRFVGWMAEARPQQLFVDWGLGTCPKP